MRLDLFSKGDSVLLLGEGNFSFAKSLVTHNLPIKITATCLDNGAKYKTQLENIGFLREKKIPVFLDVDATKLHEHPILTSQLYSKIIFNFPHVGGKMKIQLNRELVRGVCESSSRLLKNDGLLIISLCNGQGGTPLDNPQRKWDDSWQVTEMAAYGSFCLISVEPFDFNNFQTYTCTGYRSQDSNFNLKGALVHVFWKKLTQSRLIDDELAVNRLSLMPLTHDSDISVPFYYSDLYLKSPLNNSKSSASFFQSLLLKNIEKCHPRINVNFVNDKRISIAVEGLNGVVCRFGGQCSRLRSSAMQVIDNIVEEFNNLCVEENVMFFPGMFFNSCTGEDFEKTPPISLQFVLLGECVSFHFKNFLNDLESLFQTDEIELCKRIIYSTSDNRNEASAVGSENIGEHINESVSNCVLGIEWQNGVGNILAHELHLEQSNIKLKAFIIYVDKLTEIFFHTNNWKEIWSEDSFVSLDSDKIPILNQGILFPLLYKFDITLKYETEKGLLDDDVYETLRFSAVDMIKAVEMINEYNSCTGWSSKCYRITYQSLSEPLNRSKALDIHSNLISKMLTLALPVTIK